MVTDRCLSYYLYHQNALQVSKYSFIDDECPQELSLKHLFAVVYRFKGGHDADGKVTKMEKESNALKTRKALQLGTSMFQCLEAVHSKITLKKSKSLRRKAVLAC